MGWTKKKDKWHCFFLWENWEHPKPSFKFLVGDQTLRFLEVRTGMTNLSPSTTSPEPGSPQPAGAFNWRLSEENSWPTQRQATDPSGPTTDDRSTNKKNWSLCTLPLPRLRPIWCHFVLSYYIESLLPFGRSSTLEFPSYIDLDATKNRRSPKLFVLK